MSVLVVASLLMLALVPGFAQDDAPPVLILPVNAAQFLPGALFDFRVEVHAEELPEDFAVTVNGEDAAAFFGAEPTEESWEFGGRIATVSFDGAQPADFTLDQLAGDYYNAQFGVVTVTVEGDVVSATLGGEDIGLETLADAETPSFNVTSGVAEGQTLAFGFNADGGLTGFSVAGQNFGVLTTLPTPSNSVIWRDVMFAEAGEVTVEVTAGGASHTAAWTVREAGMGEAQNVIVFVADGMSVPLLTAARIASQGITQGTLNGEFPTDSMEAVGLAHTSSIDSLMADSANTASALNTGHIGSVNATGTYSDTSPSRLDDPRVETFGSLVQRLRGYSVGIVSTADWSDATPAAVWAHGRDRSDANRAEYVSQALEFAPEVLLGGGARRLLPQSAEGSRRSDDRDMFAEFAEAGYTVVTSATELNDAMGETPERLLGVFHPGDLNVWLDRNVYTENLGDFTDQPGLVDMTLAALDVLGQDEDGFFLFVEAASVDKQIHPLDQERALSDLIEFQMAIAAAQEWVAENAPDTLIVVTSDHAHGYDVYGTVNTEVFNAGETDIERRAGIRVYAGAGYPTYSDPDGDGFPDWDASIVFAGTVNNHPEYTEDFQVSPVPRVPAMQNEDGIYVDNPEDDPNGILMSGNLGPRDSTGVHTLQDVPVFATGPGAECLTGVYHQREVFFCIAAAVGLNPAAEAEGM
ncbi:MAG: alkaline phosphatase [bacterium]|nr:alkaline phosphatase [bacterium]